jgi:DNA gyrase subunit A
LRWVRLAKDEDSVIVGSSNGMAIHFKTDDNQLRPLGRNTRGVKSMKLRKGDEIIGMDILSSQLTANMSEVIDDVETEEDETEMAPQVGPAVEPTILVLTTGGLGKRVPVNQFRLQNRAGKGKIAIKFRKPNDKLAALRVVNEDHEFIIVTSRGIIIRQVVKAISCQSRTAGGVRVQKLDDSDAIVAMALVPSSGEEDESPEASLELEDALLTPEVQAEEPQEEE